MRLIDADKAKLMMSELLEVAKHEGFTAEDAIEHACIWIDNQPTAHDVEKVVEQLEKERSEYEQAWDEFDCADDFGGMCAMDIAIKIVRAGGKE